MGNEERLEELLLRCQELNAQGRTVSPQELCADCPELAEVLQRQLETVDYWEYFLGMGANAHRSDAALSIPDYQILGELGSGGMGIVYLARNKVLGQVVALKILLPGTPAYAGRIERFKREARSLALLRHEHIVRLYEARFYQGEFYYVMEYLGGGSLADHMGEYTQNPVKAAALVEQVARAVHHAHGHGILHRDLKPANILLDDTGRPMVADFGMARFLASSVPGEDETGKGEPNDQGLTTTGVQPGTPLYMAPEQFDTTFGQVSERTDVWALGVILYEVVTGHRPFAGQDLVAIRRAICDQDMIDPNQRKPLDRRLRAIILKCLQKEPAARYANASKVANDLAAWQKGELIEAAPDSLLVRWGRRVRRHPTLIAATILVASLVTLWLFQVEPTNVLAEWQYQRHASRVQHVLAQGMAGILIGPDTRELAHRWRLGAGEIKWNPNQEQGVLSVGAKLPSLLELLPSTNLSAFRLRVLIRHDAANGPFGEIGIYLAYHHVVTPEGPHHFFVNVAFSEERLRSKEFKDKQWVSEGRLRLDLYHQWVSLADPFNRSVYQINAIRFTPETDPSQREFREIVVKVREGTITAWLEGCSIDVNLEKASEQWFPKLREYYPDLRGSDIDLPIRGPIGLYLNDSRMSIQRFIVEPLDLVAE
jgi:serine/threonine protein kinase